MEYILHLHTYMASNNTFCVFGSKFLDVIAYLSHIYSTDHSMPIPNMLMEHIICGKNYFSGKILREVMD